MGPWQCLLRAWIAAWVVAIFLPSLLIAYLGLSEQAAAVGTGFDRLVVSSLTVADEVGPAVKLTIGGILLLAFVALERAVPADVRLRYPIGGMIGIVAMLVAMAFVPAGYTRGFAAGLTGERFDPAVWPLYLLSGAVAGLAYVASSGRCKRRMARQP